MIKNNLYIYIRKFRSYKKGVISFASRVTTQNKFLIWHREHRKNEKSKRCSCMKMLFDIPSTIKVSNTPHVTIRWVFLPWCEESLRGIQWIALPVDAPNKLNSWQREQQWRKSTINTTIKYCITSKRKKWEMAITGHTCYCSRKVLSMAATWP